MSSAYICSADGLELLGRCSGPAPGARCPRVLAGELVACAGRTLLARSPDSRRSLLLAVEADAEACPLASASWPDRTKDIWPSCGN